MEKLNNWNAWCNDKIVLHNSDNGLPVLLSPNAVLAIEQTAEDTCTIALVDGMFFDVKGTAEEILGIIGECVAESEARKKAVEEEQRKRYEEAMKAEQAAKEASEG